MSEAERKVEEKEQLAPPSLSDSLAQQVRVSSLENSCYR